MALLSALLDVIVPVLVVVVVGAILGRTFAIDPRVIAKIGLYALTPALCIQTLLTTKVSGSSGALLIGVFVVLTVLGAVLGWLATPGQPSRTRRSSMVAVSIGNNGNLGLPIAMFALGQHGFDYSILIFLASVVLTFIVGPMLYGAADGPVAALRAIIRLPALWAMAIAVSVRWAGVPVPTGIGRGIELLSQATLPIILLTLGIQLGVTKGVRLTRAVIGASLARVLALPLIGLPLGYAAGLRGLELQALVLSLAMPTAVNALLLAHEYQGDVHTVADTVTVTTLLSFLSAAVVTAALPWIGSLG